MTRTSAHALHALLLAVRNSGKATVAEGWQEVLGCDPNSFDWAQRHGATVRLHQQVVEQVQSLPEGEPARARAIRYSPLWYNAVVWPNAWQTNQQAANGIISHSDLDQLEATADHLALRLAGTSVTPRLGDLARLREEVDEWMTLVADTPDLPEPVRTEIAGQLRHVLWLLENVDIYGAASVVRETQTAVGKVGEAVFTRMGTTPWKKKWVQHYGSLLVALGLLTQGLDATNLVLENAKETLSVVAEVAQEADDLLDQFRGPKKLEAGEPKALPPAPPRAGDQPEE